MNKSIKNFTPALCLLFTSLLSVDAKQKATRTLFDKVNRMGLDAVPFFYKKLSPNKEKYVFHFMAAHLNRKIHLYTTDPLSIAEGQLLETKLLETNIHFYDKVDELKQVSWYDYLGLLSDIEYKEYKLEFEKELELIPSSMDWKKNRKDLKPVTIVGRLENEKIRPRFLKDIMPDDFDIDGHFNPSEFISALSRNNKRVKKN